MPLLPNALARTTRNRERVLVVLQLSGGNDGLNTVIPRTQDAYYRIRPTLAIGSNAVHALDKNYGLHPSMGALAQVFEEQKLAVLHGIGHTVSERSHFRSMEIWHTASAALPLADTGWLGRLADQISARSPGSMSALHIGAGTLPLALRGHGHLPPTVRDPKGFLLEPNTPAFASSRDRILSTSSADGDLDFLRNSAESTYSAAKRMAELTSAKSSVSYPNTELGRQLKLVARLISGDFGTRVFQVELGGFDHHSRQAPAHQALLGQLSNALRRLPSRPRWLRPRRPRHDNGLQRVWKARRRERIARNRPRRRRTRLPDGLEGASGPARHRPRPRPPRGRRRRR